MTEQDDQSPWAPPGGTTPGSSLPPPAPPTAPPPPPVAPTDVLMIEPVEADPPGPSGRWLGRGLALAGAAVIVAGGGFLALNAGTSDSGADAPEAAVAEMLEALSSEDVIGAAELIEPVERETLVAAGLDLADELVRLEVLAADLDLGSISGIDLDFANVELRSERVSDDVANIFIEQGTFSASYDADALPFGPLVLERVSQDWLMSSDIASSNIADSDVIPITTVERDGRWYVSLWYTVGENARSALEEPFPAVSARPVPLGAESPEAAVRRLVDEAENLDLRQIIRMLDPDEARALYDYAPLFLDDADAAAAEVLAETRGNGTTWDVHTLELHAEGDGDRATVIVDSIGFSLRSDEFTVDIDATPDSFVMDMVNVDPWDDSVSAAHLESNGDCMTVTTDDRYDGPRTEEYCADDFLGGVGLSTSLLAGTSGVLNPALGIETHRVGGSWYVSPTRTITEPLLATMRAWSPEDIASIVDAMIGLVEDPIFADGPFFAEDFGSSGFSGDSGFVEVEPAIPLGSTTTWLPDQPVDPLLGVENVDLLDPSLDTVFAYDIDPSDLGFELGFWLPEVTPPALSRGVFANVSTETGTAVVIVIEPGDPAAAAIYLEQLASLEATTTVDLNGVAVIETVDSVGDPVLAGTSGASVVIVGTYGATLDEMRSAMATQLLGR